MRLGEFRTASRDFDNKLHICLSDYSDGTVKKLEMDMATETCIFLRVVEE